MIDVMNKTGYNFGTVGNHEFDRGEKKLERLIKRSKFKIVAANVKSKRIKIPSYSIYNPKGNLKIGVTGILTTETLKIIGEKSLKNFSITSETAALITAVKKLKKLNSDLIICLSHCGSSADSAIAPLTPDVDLFFGGHDHRGKEIPWKVDGSKTLLLSNYAKGSSIGQLEVLFDKKNKKIVEYNNILFPIEYSDTAIDTQLNLFIAEKSADIDKIMNVEAASSGIELRRPTQADSMYISTPLGNLLCDVLKKTGKADIALYNHSGIRNSINAGKILLRDIYLVEPFGNTVYTLKLKGKEIKNFFNSIINDPYHYLQISGLLISYKKENSEDTSLVTKYIISKITLSNGTELKDEQFYTIAVPNYIAGGNDGFTVFNNGISKTDTLVAIRDALKNYLASQKKDYEFTNRIIFVQ